MFGKSVKIIVTLFVTIELYQCTVIQPEEMLQSRSDFSEPVVPNRGDFTYQASIRGNFTYTSYFCTGAIISDRWVLTSSSCVRFSFLDIFGAIVVLGGFDISEGIQYPCDLVKMHELFQLGSFEYDIALMRTSSSILFDEFIQPIPYYKGSIEGDISAVLIGWGQIWVFYFLIACSFSMNLS